MVVAGLCLLAVVYMRTTYSDRFFSETFVAPVASMVRVFTPPDTASASPVVSAPTPALPKKAATARLSIPSIKVNAAIESVGINQNGEMDTPLRLADVGLYKYGTMPGQVGSAVIDGHVDNGLSLPAVFYNLKKVQKGDDVYITNPDGTQLHFAVTSIDDYELATAPVEQIFHDTSGRLLKLITCEGTWSGLGYAYDHRVIVTAELI